MSDIERFKELLCEYGDDERQGYESKDASRDDAVVFVQALIEERDRLRAEVERMRPVVEAAVVWTDRDSNPPSSWELLRAVWAYQETK